MTAVRRTAGILIAAGAVAAGSLFLQPRARGADDLGPSGVSRGGIELRAMTAGTHVPRGAHEVLVAVTLEADRRGDASRPPVNIAIVLDRSGSMGGDKLRHAKRAARALIAQLRPSDRVAVISYSSEVDVITPATLATADATHLAAAQIDRLYDDGETNLAAALATAERELAPAVGPERLSRILLISDGAANQGTVEPEVLTRIAGRIGEGGISITTIGIGTDFDERTMTAIAAASHGNYYFADRPAALESWFAEELRRLGSTRATDIALEVIPAQGVEVIDALGYPVGRGPESVLIPIAELRDGDRRKVVLRLRVAPTLTANQGAGVRLGRFTARYRAPGASEIGTLTIELDATVATSAHPRLVAEASRHIERALTAMAIERATELDAAGRSEEATQVLERRAAEAGDSDPAASIEVRSALDRARRRLEAPAPSPAGRRELEKANRSEAYDLLVR